MIKTLKKRTHAESRDSLLSCFIREIHGDSKQTIMLCSSMEAIQTLANVGIPDVSPIDVGKSIGVDTGKGSKFVIFHNEVQDVFKNAISHCYGKYNCLHSPLVSESEINTITRSFKDKFPFQVVAIESLLNIQSKSVIKNNYTSRLIMIVWYFGNSYQ